MLAPGEALRARLSATSSASWVPCPYSTMRPSSTSLPSTSSAAPVVALQGRWTASATWPATNCSSGLTSTTVTPPSLQRSVTSEGVSCSTAEDAWGAEQVPTGSLRANATRSGRRLLTAAPPMAPTTAKITALISVPLQRLGDFAGCGSEARRNTLAEPTVSTGYSRGGTVCLLGVAVKRGGDLPSDLVARVRSLARRPREGLRRLPSRAHGLLSRLLVFLATVEPVTEASEPPERTVIVVAPVDSPPLPRQRLTEALRSQLAELGVRVVFSAAPVGSAAAEESSSLARHRDVLAVVWLERTGEALVVHFYEPAGSSLRERRIPVATTTDAASIEEVAVVIRSAANALLERRAAEPHPVARPAPSLARPPRVLHPSPAPAPPPESQGESYAPLQLAVGYTGTLYGAETPWQSGASGSVAWRVGMTPWRLGAAYEWFPSLRHQTDGVTLTVKRYPFEVFGGYEVLMVGLPASLRPELGLMVEPAVRKTEEVGASLEGTAGKTRWTWAVAARLRLAVNPVSAWWIDVALGADFLLNPFDYVVGRQEEASVLSPLPSRPCLELGVAVDVP